jgi:hypothetical protein
MNLCEPSKFELRYTQKMTSLMRSNQIFGDLRKMWMVTNLAKSLKNLVVSIPIIVEKKSSKRRDRGLLGIWIAIYLNPILRSAVWIDNISERLSCTKQSNRRVSYFDQS